MVNGTPTLANHPIVDAYDRIQRAGTRSPFIIGDIVIVYELCKDGIRIRATRGERELTQVVTWKQLAMSVVDPLIAKHEDMLREMTNAGS